MLGGTGPSPRAHWSVVIRLENVSKVYSRGARPALEDVDVEQEQIVAKKKK